MSHHHDDPTVTVLTGPVDPLTQISLRTWITDPQTRAAAWQQLARRTAAPAPVHQRLRALESSGQLRALLTEDVHRTHQRAGCKHPLELFGTAATSSCVVCLWRTDTAVLLQQLAIDPDLVCPQCGGTLRPDVRLGMELVDDQMLTAAIAAVQDAHLFIVIGSALETFPSTDLVSYAQDQGAQVVLLNTQATAFDAMADQVRRGDAAAELTQLLSDWDVHS